MGRVVVDRADNYAPRPRRSRTKRSALELSSVVAGFQVFHFSGAARFDPIWKMIEFGEFAYWSDSGKFKSSVMGRFPY